MLNVHTITPFTGILDHQTDQTSSMGGKRALQSLQYLARPIDNLIKIVAFVILGIVRHFLDIHNEFLAGQIKRGGIKLLLTPVTLPISLVMNGSLLVIRVAVEIAFDAVIPVRTIADIIDPQTRVNDRYNTKTHTPDDLIFFKTNMIIII